MPTNENDPSAAVEAAQRLQSSLENANLHIASSRIEFDARTSGGEDSSHGLPLTFSENSRLVDPANVSLDVAAQLAFFRKLKFQYLEQKAKDQYIKIIVSDDAPDISAQDNEKLRLANDEKKEKLKQEKLKLTETYNNIRTLAPLIEQDYNKAKTLTSEVATLAQQVLDARLKLIRLRQTHPQPRLTISGANAQLDSQVAEMQNLEDTLREVNDSIERVKVKVKDSAKEVERLRVERGDAEKQAKAAQSDVEDPRVVGLYDWFTASLKLHQELFSMESFTAPSENELKLAYSLDLGVEHRRVTITLLFHPNTRRLAEVQVDGLSSNIEELVWSHAQANDVPGLIAALLARARAEG